jgi:capsular polysaccharide biosynthesis protein
MAPLLRTEEGARPEHEAAVEFERDRVQPRVNVLDAVRRHKLLAALPAIVLVALALIYGFARTPTYTAEAYQSIGRIDVNQPGALSGFQQATATLATTYSRAVRSTAVVRSVSEQTGLSSSEVRERLGAYPVPQSSVFVVAATGPSSSSAIELSILGTRELREYIEKINTENPNGERLFREFRRASLERAERREELERMRILFFQRSDGDLTRSQIRALGRARAWVEAATLERDVARANYGRSQNSQSMVSLVQDLALPETASSDRWDRLQILLFIALAVGVLLGLALATLRANRDTRRSPSVR